MTKKLIILAILTIGALNEMAAIQKLISGFQPGNINRNNVTQDNGMFITRDENGRMTGMRSPLNTETPLDTFAQKEQFDDYSLPGRIQPPNIRGDDYRKHLGSRPTEMRRKQTNDRLEQMKAEVKEARRKITENGAQNIQ
jgi:hypothetical protein